MVRPNREPLIAPAQADETYIGASKPGKRGRGAAGKALVVGAVECRRVPLIDKKTGCRKTVRHLGRVRLATVAAASAMPPQNESVLVGLQPIECLDESDGVVLAPDEVGRLQRLQGRVLVFLRPRPNGRFSHGVARDHQARFRVRRQRVQRREKARHGASVLPRIEPQPNQEIAGGRKADRRDGI